MFDYIQKYNNLPKEVRNKIGTPEIVAEIDELKNKYRINLAGLVMKVMVKEINPDEIKTFLILDEGMDIKNAEELNNELLDKVFKNVYDYLGIKAEKLEIPKNIVFPQIEGSNELFLENEEKELLGGPWSSDKLGAKNQAELEKKAEELMKEAKLSFPSTELNQRLKNILVIYLRGTRGKVDTRQALSKFVDFGGLGLDDKTIDKIFLASQKYFIEDSREKVPFRKITVKEDELLPSLIKSANEDLKKAKAAPVKTEIKEPLGKARDIEYDFSKLKEIKKPQTPLKQEEKKDKTEEVKVDKTVASAEQAPKKKGKILKLLSWNKEKELAPPVPVVIEPKKIIQTGNEIGLIKKEPLNILKKDESKPGEKTNFFDFLKTEKPKSPKEKVLSEIEKAQELPLIKKEEKPNLDIKTEEKTEEKSVSEKKKNFFSFLKGNKSISPKEAEPKEQKNELENAQLEPKLEPKKETPLPKNSQKAFVPNAPNYNINARTGKVSMADIKYVPRTLSPIEELKAMNLTTFHRLSGDPHKAGEKIKNKILLLGEEGLKKLVEGVKAWRVSPVNQLYLKIGHQSIVDKTSVENVIQELKAKKEEYLTSEEFSAIMDLNKELRY